MIHREKELNVEMVPQAVVPVLAVLIRPRIPIVILIKEVRKFCMNLVAYTGRWNEN